MNTKNMLRTGLSICAVFALSGCLKGTGLQGSLAEVVYDSITEVGELESQTTVMPTGGTASYTGSALIQMADSATTTNQRVMAGEATLDASFSAAGGAVSGTLQNFVGAKDVNMQAFNTAVYSGTVADVEAQLADFSPVDGKIDVTSDTSTGERFTVGFSGTLTQDGDTIMVGGTGAGQFVGADADGVKIYGGTTLNGFGTQSTLTENGTAQEGQIYINATK
ncbi:hypothetical protein [Maritimibacter sp. UBA3975]|uniref:hypothetical protein n=1 Tax=Maritimibacter sp. UBA3975 TaxID=1946833 RepID=UPI000C0A8965|nr:hypothetical protein [Maritimibacter sp. UBA3975]MAM60326.1 hypothetical protein [Maritimibacter sp.]|tara:strand:+ start:17418 stop:18083 length:666 start_codon:yes stop_codon:yes gene_type:complete